MNKAISEKFKRNLSFYIGFVGSAFLFSFGINSILDGHLYLGLTLLSFMAIGVISLGLMVYRDHTPIGQNGVSIVVVFLFTYLSFTGGIQGTGILWAYPLVLIILLLQGFKRGIAALALFIIIILVIFYGSLDQAHQYNSTFKVRFLSTFFALSLMALIYEYQRWQAHEESILIHDKLSKTSRQDPLTDLLNRRASNCVLEKESAIYLRHRTEFSIIMIDLDLFKRINDTYGHNVGDDVLVAVAHELNAHTRIQDQAVRWGGEEFLVILPDTNKEQAREAAEVLRSKINALQFDHLNVTERITASFGVQSMRDSKDLNDLIVQADKKLYLAKQQGRNRVVF